METALAETIWHDARRLAQSNSPSVDLHMREFNASIDARLHTLAGHEADFPGIGSTEPDDYTASRAFGSALHASGSRGLHCARARGVPWRP